jgi:hypothetical protein
MKTFTQMSKSEVERADDSRSAAYRAVQHRMGQNPGAGVFAHDSPRMLQQNALFDAIRNSPRAVAQRRQLDSLFPQSTEESRNGRTGEVLRSNSTAMPDRLKAGIESLGGMSLDNVRVHYDSPQPAQLNALAYAKGHDIHLAPGQTRHLPHEAWHLIQQAQGRVKPTGQAPGGVLINDDEALEHEADTMGAKAAAQLTASAAGQTLAHQSDLEGSARLRNSHHPLAWITQLVAYPKDKWGSIAGSNTKVNGEPEEVSLDVLQQRILNIAQAAGKAGGYRLGSFEYVKGNLQHVPKRETEEDHGMPLLPENFSRGELYRLLEPFVIAILKEADQLDYINQNEAAIVDTHDVVIDVDCQFNRWGRTGYHKDSRGTTAFVNLTYNNKDGMQGPDYYEDLEGDPGLESRLPLEVQKDIKERREAGASGLVDSEELPAHGRISFSDPNLYHSTPPLGHRKGLLWGTKDRMVAYLISQGREELVKSTTDEDLLKEATKQAMIKHLGTLGFDEKKLLELDESSLAECYSYWAYNVHIFEDASTKKDSFVRKAEATAKAERRLSTRLKSGAISQEELNEQVATPRTFLRTWVRFVPRL